MKIMSALLGNVLEWYDFILYSYFAQAIAYEFFPKESPEAGLLAAFAVFAVGFLSRPLGSLFYGTMGDRKGRKTALSQSMILMGLPTLLIALIPSFETIGLWAPFCLILCRLAQGLSVGGEYPLSILFLTEHAPRDRKGLMGSLVLTGAGFGWLLGSGIAGLSMTYLPPGLNFRIPFLLGGCLALLGAWIRKYTSETPVFLKTTPLSNPVWTTLKNYKGKLFLLLSLNSASAVGGYLIYAYMPTFLSTHGGLSLPAALSLNAWMLLLFNGLALVSGWLSDRWGSLFVMSLGGFGLLASVPLTTLLLEGGSFVVVGYGLLTLSMALYHAPLPSLMAEMFPPEVKASGVGIAYNVAVSLFSGTAPMVATWLILTTGSPLAPAVYLTLMSVVSLSGLGVYAYQKRQTVLTTYSYN